MSGRTGPPPGLVPSRAGPTPPLEATSRSRIRNRHTQSWSRKQTAEPPPNFRRDGRDDYPAGVTSCSAAARPASSRSIIAARVIAARRRSRSKPTSTGLQKRSILQWMTQFRSGFLRTRRMAGFGLRRMVLPASQGCSPVGRALDKQFLGFRIKQRAAVWMRKLGEPEGLFIKDGWTGFPRQSNGSAGWGSGFAARRAAKRSLSPVLTISIGTGTASSRPLPPRSRP